MNFEIKMDKINLYQCEKGFTTSKRVFDYPYILYVHKGRGIYRIGSKNYNCRSGDIYFCPIGEENTIIADKDEPYLLSGLEITTNDANYLNKNILEKLNLISDTFSLNLINKLIDEYLFSKVYSKEICDNLATAFIYELFRLSKMDFQDSGKSRETDILEYVNENYYRQIQHRDLEKIFNYHRNTINNMLKKMTGMSLKNYQIDLRIKHAEKLLIYSDKGIEEIGELCGYISSGFFSRQFKEKTNFSPLEYRKKVEFKKV